MQTDTRNEDVMGLYELLAADPSALRHSDWVELQRLAREWNAALGADKKDAARMREVDALVSGGRLLDRERLMVRADDLMLRDTHGRVDAADLAIENVTAFAAALLTDGAVEAFDNGYDNAFAPELDRFRAGIRAAIKAAGVEVVERTRSCPRCDMHAAEAKQLGQTLNDVARAIGRMHEADGHADHRASDSEIVARCRELSEAEWDITAEQVAHAKTRKDHESAMRRADQARAEADALRAEVAALRGLASHAGAIDAAVSIFDFPSGKIVRGRMIDAIGAALSVVPASSPAAAPKAEAPGLEPLEMLELLGFTWPKGDVDVGLTHAFNGLVERVNVLSAIAKRGAL